MEQDPSLDNLVHPEGYATIPLGTFGHVEKRGTGPVPMVLIPGGGFGWRVFESYMDANANEYTMYAVSLAGMGGTPAPPMPPPGTSYGELTWIRGGVVALFDLVDREKLERPVVVGHFLEGTHVALRAAIEHPEKIGAVAILSGSAKYAVPGRELTLQDRVRYQDEKMAPNWFKTVTLKTWNDNNFPPSTYSRDPERGVRLFEDVSHGPLPVFVRYLIEYYASDLSLEFERIRTPLLLLIPGFDEALLAGEATKWLPYFFIDGWTGIEKNPLVERRTVENARIFLWVDEPEVVDREIDGFVEKRLFSRKGSHRLESR
jgi:pimeloyl-ACP methyl ester carboxylesterase